MSSIGGAASGPGGGGSNVPMNREMPWAQSSLSAITATSMITRNAIRKMSFQNHRTRMF
jgi:hypothetical protein